MYPEIVEDARGIGTFCAISCSTPELRDVLSWTATTLGEFHLLDYFDTIDAVCANNLYKVNKLSCGKR